ncbi:ArsR/SmtB family transcription factor [Nakamurella leprariae]|uniref:Helix-turn-helix transcriptional regulator n=1 Tax=Nakamurella leprariae TaxID=2803911 RepID=A0A938YA70_9ACTN|nr:metalloregulator ArsR/SmtB family transcription factor [Nakamurella leprariae]MBM9468735.1 helix-turn-helix transcriptional regulator [Nakamurella leprariae]
MEQGTPADPEPVGTSRPDQVERWADAFRTMADINRLKILLAVHHSPGINVTDLAATVGMSANATSHALRALRDQGIIRTERAGRERRCRLVDEQVHGLLHGVGATHAEQATG